MARAGRAARAVQVRAKDSLSWHVSPVQLRGWPLHAWGLRRAVPPLGATPPPAAETVRRGVVLPPLPFDTPHARSTSAKVNAHSADDRSPAESCRRNCGDKPRAAPPSESSFLCFQPFPATLLAMAPVALDTSAPVSTPPPFKQDLSSLSKNPLQRTYRGNKEGTIHMEGIPQFDDPYQKREWVKVRYLLSQVASYAPRAELITDSRRCAPAGSFYHVHRSSSRSGSSTGARRATLRACRDTSRSATPSCRTTCVWSLICSSPVLPSLPLCLFAKTSPESKLTLPRHCAVLDERDRGAFFGRDNLEPRPRLAGRLRPPRRRPAPDQRGGRADSFYSAPGETRRPGRGALPLAARQGLVRSGPFPFFACRPSSKAEFSGHVRSLDTNE